MSDWQAVADPDSGATYYYNAATGMSSAPRNLTWLTMSAGLLQFPERRAGNSIPHAINSLSCIQVKHNGKSLMDSLKLHPAQMEQAQRVAAGLHTSMNRLVQHIITMLELEKLHGRCPRRCNRLRWRANHHPRYVDKQCVAAALCHHANNSATYEPQCLFRQAAWPI